MFILFALLVSLSFAHVIQDQVAVSDRAEFSFKTVCEKSVPNDSPLIEVHSGTELDCMGRKVQVGKFCEKELASDPFYLRGYVDSETKKVVCVSGKKVLFKYLCVKLGDQKLCSQEARASCKGIQEKLAKRLDLVHSSFVKNEKGIKQLNCFYESLPLREKSL
jgi:DNA-binding XRE family transcriptional regulator